MDKLQKMVEEFCRKHDLKTSPEHRALDMVSEVGEVAKELLWMTDYGKNPMNKSDEIEMELGDLMFSLSALANHFEVDLEKAMKKALDKYKKRLDKGSAGSEVEKS